MAASSPLPLTPKVEAMSSARKEIRATPRSDVPLISDMFGELQNRFLFGEYDYDTFMPKMSTLLSALRMTRVNTPVLQRASREEAIKIVDTALQLRGETPLTPEAIFSSSRPADVSDPSYELDEFRWYITFVDSEAAHRIISAHSEGREEAQLLALQKLRLAVQELTQVPFRMGIDMRRDQDFEVVVDTAKGQGERLRSTIRRNLYKLNAALDPLALKLIEFSEISSGYNAHAEVYDANLKKLNQVLRKPNESVFDGLQDFRDILREVGVQELFRLQLQGAYYYFLALAWAKTRYPDRDGGPTVRATVEGEYEEASNRQKLVSVPSRLDPSRVDLSLLPHVFRGVIGESRVERTSMNNRRSSRSTQWVGMMRSRRADVKENYWIFGDMHDKYAITYDANFFGTDAEEIQKGHLQSLCGWADCADFKAIPLTIEWYKTPDSSETTAHSLVMYLQRTGKIFLYDRNGYAYDCKDLSTFVRRVLCIMDDVLGKDYYTRLYVGGLHEEIPSFRWSRGSCAMCGRFLPQSRREDCPYCAHNCLPTQRSKEINGDGLVWRSVPSEQASGLSLYYTETVTGGEGGTCVWFTLRHITLMATGNRMDSSKHGHQITLTRKKWPTWSEPLYALFYLYEERLGTAYENLATEVSKTVEWFWTEPRRYGAMRKLTFAGEEEREALRASMTALRF